LAIARKCLPVDGQSRKKGSSGERLDATIRIVTQYVGVSLTNSGLSTLGMPANVGHESLPGKSTPRQRIASARQSPLIYRIWGLFAPGLTPR